ncbi:MAG: Tetratricopeptide repeat protein [Deltaproteobacteria bacterium ADurb.Bin510]|nr:MAG: Tetratricopeptide repeat protein [Deltaproteobacteria bacterium ADurb.Bin510]
MRYRCTFNLGNTAFKQGDYARAADYYRQGLRIKPDDAGLKANLELALRQLQRQSKNQAKQGQAGQKQQSPGGQQQKQPGQNQQPPGAQKQQKPNQSSGTPNQQQAQGQKPPAQAGKPGVQNQAPTQPGQAAQQSQPQPAQAGAARPGRSELDRQRAAALIESVRENRPPRSGSGELPPSGKYW